ncbi:tetratricopeptide repeat protein [Lignipirellula cremea]|uniref:tetratricopeptide repeat protein n=1 Tax=Lignipirellula cremea TaxID=2528010 RepID=UPI0011A09F7F|nr:tetratricopeptide repeat protein [Lignipirellula cremea]
MAIYSKKTIACLAISAACCGCTSPFGKSKTDPLRETPSATSPARTSSGALGRPQAEPTTSQTIMQTGANFFGALTPKAKVIPAADPLDLNYGPQKMSPDVHIAAGQVHERNGLFDAAEAQYQKALSVDASNLTAMLHLGRLYDRQENFGGANKTYQAAVKAHPQSAVALNDMGLCLARQGRFAESQRILARAVEIAPNNRMYRNNAATVLVENGQIQEAYQQLASVNRDAVAHYNLAVLLYQHESLDKAHEHFTLAGQLDPSMTEALQMAARLQQPSAEPTAVAAQPAPASYAPSQPSYAASQPSYGSAQPQRSNPYQTVSGARPLQPSDSANVQWPGIRQPNVQQQPAPANDAPAAPAPYNYGPNSVAPEADLRMFPPVR